MRLKPTSIALACVCMFSILTACNEDSDVRSYTDTPVLAVKGFKLQADNKHIGLDSVYFAIDLNHRVIYNPDSLRPDMPIDKIIPTISYDSNVTSVTIEMKNRKNGNDTTTNYKENPTDTIDFTGKVTITLGYGVEYRSYDVKVNVHKEYADSLRWDEAARTTLPSRLGNPVNQKTVQLENSTAVSLLQESDGSYTLATSTELYDNRWSKTPVTLPFTPDINSLAATGNDLYILSTDGSLYKGDIAGNWTSTGQQWDCLIGGYTGTAVGLRTVGGKAVFAQYPLRDINETAAPDDFPRSGFSNFVTLQNKWTLSPVAFFVGGKKADGSISPATWAFDGTEWIRLNDADIPPMEQACLVPYYYYRSTNTGGRLDEFAVWMLIGGRKADGKANRTVYITYDNGVNWRKGASLLQLPDVIPDMWGSDNVVALSPKSANISDNWKIMARGNAQARLPHQVEGDIISWECPYIYLIGGYDANGRLCDTIWRGVLARLTFVPII